MTALLNDDSRLSAQPGEGSENSKFLALLQQFLCRADQKLNCSPPLNAPAAPRMSDSQKEKKRWMQASI